MTFHVKKFTLRIKLLLWLFKSLGLEKKLLAKMLKDKDKIAYTGMALY